MKFVAALAFLGLAACVTHVLSDADAAQLQRAERLAGSVYVDLDAGLTQAKARAAYCGVNDVLAHSNDALDGGPVNCGAAQ